MAKEDSKKLNEDADPNIIINSDDDHNPTENGLAQKNLETVLIVNPASSGGSTGKDWETQFARIKQAFDKEPKLVYTKKSGDGTTLTRELLKNGSQNIVAIGGDGTINEVANGFFEESNNLSNSLHDSGNTQKNRGKRWKIRQENGNISKFPTPPLMTPISPEATLGLLPSGTRNVLAKSLDLPQDMNECCNNLVKSKPKKIDVITATVTSTVLPGKSSRLVTRVFLNAAEIGVGAEIIDRSKKVRNKIKSRLLSTIASIFVTLPGYVSNMSEIVLDDRREKIRTKMTMAVIANGRFLGGGFKTAPKADVSDGLLDLVILKNSGSFKMLDDFVNLKEGDSSNEGDILYRQAKKVSIKSKERNVTVAIDGEPIGILPATFEVLHNALTIRV